MKIPRQTETAEDAYVRHDREMNDLVVELQAAIDDVQAPSESFQPTWADAETLGSKEFKLRRLVASFDGNWDAM